jgi:hypothetical protein
MFGYSSPPVYIESGVVTAVYPQEYLADVITVKTKRILKKVPYATPLLAGKHGINFCPPRGSFCWVMLSSSDPSNSSVQISPTILAWQSVQEGGSHKGGRKDLDESDICIDTPGGAELLLRAGGLAEIRGGAFARTLYIPTTNSIYSIAQNVETHTPTGDFVWSTQDAEDVSGNSVVAFTLRQVASDAAAFLKITAGETTGGLEVVILKDGSAGGDEIGEDGKPANFACSWKLDKEGTIRMEAKKSIEVTAEESISVSSQEITISSESSIKVTCAKEGLSSTIEITPSAITIKTRKLSVMVEEGVEILTPIGQPILSIKEGSPSVLTSALLPFILTHTHSVAGGATLSPTEALNVVESSVTTQSAGIA